MHEDRGNGEDTAVPQNGIKEGKARVVGMQGNEVFYNPVQVLNRDLSVIAIQEFQKIFQKERNERSAQKFARAEAAYEKAVKKAAEAGETTGHPAPVKPGPAAGLKVLDALSASGLRAMRYTLEIDGLESVMANDLDATAVEAIQRNCEINDIPTGKVIPHHGDASLVCYMHRDEDKRFDVLDLDPYGAPTPFIDGAVQAVSEGGLLCVTATDMAVLCGKNSEVCYSKYGVMSLRGIASCHEFAIRGVLASLESAANRYKRHIVPVLSFQTDFYLRVFVRVYTSPAAVKASATKLAYVYNCQGCGSQHLQRVGKMFQKGNQVKYSPATAPPVAPLCEQCGSKFNMGGPIWAEPYTEPQFLSSCIAHLETSRDKYKSYERLHGMLSATAVELHDVPLYYSLHAMCKVLHCQVPPLAAVRSAIQVAGYRVSTAHTEPLALKSDAPPRVLWDIMRCWVRDNPIKAPKETSPAFKLLAQVPQLKADFTLRPGTESGTKKIGPMFVPAPEANWGPKARASGKRGRKKSGAEGEAGDAALKQQKSV